MGIPPAKVATWVLLSLVQRERERSVHRLMAAVAQMVAEVDPDDKRDHRSLWELPLRERARRPDIFDRVRYAGDELVVLSAQIMTWRGGRSGPEPTVAQALASFALLLEREASVLEQLSRDVPALQLQRPHHPDLHAGELPAALRELRRQHERAGACLELLGTLAA